MVLGALAIAGGASALAFDGSSGAVDQSVTPTAQVQAAPVVEVAPAALVDNSQGWATQHNIAYDPTPID